MAKSFSAHRASWPRLPSTLWWMPPNTFSSRPSVLVSLQKNLAVFERNVIFCRRRSFPDSVGDRKGEYHGGKTHDAIATRSSARAKVRVEQEGCPRSFGTPDGDRDWRGEKDRPVCASRARQTRTVRSKG